MLFHDPVEQEEIAQAEPETNIKAVVVWFLIMFVLPVVAFVAVTIMANMDKQ